MLRNHYTTLDVLYHASHQQIKDALLRFVQHYGDDLQAILRRCITVDAIVDHIILPYLNILDSLQNVVFTIYPEVETAYQTLAMPQQRNRYDTQVLRQHASHAASPFLFSNPIPFNYNDHKIEMSIQINLPEVLKALQKYFKSEKEHKGSVRMLS